MAKLQTLEFTVKNNLGTLQRIAGLFSRRGMRIQKLSMEARGEGEAQAKLEFAADEETLRHLHCQLEKMADFIQLQGSAHEHGQGGKAMMVESIPAEGKRKTKSDISPARGNEGD